MKNTMGMTGEQSEHKVAGFFDDASEAQKAADGLTAQLEAGGGQVMLLNPKDSDIGPKLEPERRGIWHTLIRAHVWLALAGAVAGLIVYAVLNAMSVAFVIQNPGWSSGLLASFGAIGGLLLGGALTIRPDHAPYIHKTRAALDKGRHVVVVHAFRRSAMDEAQGFLKQRGAETVRTF